MSGPFEGWDQPIIDENPEVTVAGAQQVINRMRMIQSGDDHGRVVRINYRNYKGEERLRTIIPASLWWGATAWHPEEQWLLEAMDIEKGEMRDFALKDLGHVPQEAIDELTPQEAIEEMGGPGADETPAVPDRDLRVLAHQLGQAAELAPKLENSHGVELIDADLLRRAARAVEEVLTLRGVIMERNRLAQLAQATGATQEFTGKLMTEANDTIVSQSHTIRKLRREKGELRNAVLLHAIGIVADLRNAQPPGDRFGALNEAMGAIDNYRFTFRGEENKNG